MDRKAVNRRKFLQMATALAGGPLLGSALSGCRSILEADSSRRFSALTLPPVHVESERVIRVVTGLRPYRPSGFVIRSETFDNKLVVHNYGHGGAGVTLSWGSAELAVEKVLESGRREAVAILGCGVIGLSTAIHLTTICFLRVTAFYLAVLTSRESNRSYQTPETLNEF